MFNRINNSCIQNLQTHKFDKHKYIYKFIKYEYIIHKFINYKYIIHKFIEHKYIIYRFIDH